MKGREMVAWPRGKAHNVGVAGWLEGCWDVGWSCYWHEMEERELRWRK